MNGWVHQLRVQTNTQQRSSPHLLARLCSLASVLGVQLHPTLRPAAHHATPRELPARCHIPLYFHLRPPSTMMFTPMRRVSHKARKLATLCSATCC